MKALLLCLKGRYGAGKVNLRGKNEAKRRLKRLNLRKKAVIFSFGREKRPGDCCIFALP